ncbi:hypothetical protein KQX54_003173 [Cotesia glomerata]|uniref:Uncharacterized protein n=1 Tax=Cotesia glomerata TaxID=32391 RepID=A0AAV7I4V1_COTGL|nr:hypothetical protein KQX54_003173 [Cotesia glomerata]
MYIKRKERKRLKVDSEVYAREFQASDYNLGPKAFAKVREFGFEQQECGVVYSYSDTANTASDSVEFLHPEALENFAVSESYFNGSE